MRILYVSSLADRGGQEVILYNLVTMLDRARCEPLVVFLQDGPIAAEMRARHVETHVIATSRVHRIPETVGAIRTIAALIRSRGIDLVQTLNSRAHLYGGAAAAAARTPCVLHLQGVPLLSFSRDGLVSLLCALTPTAAIVACSKYVATGFQKAWPLKRAPIVIYSGVPPPCGSINAADVRREFQIPEEAPLVMSACRLQRGKGVHVFLEAAAQVHRQHPETRFMVVGGALFGLDAGYPAELHELAHRLGISELVTFTGHRSDVYRLLSASDVVVHSAVMPEALGAVLLEAMMAGKPVVATDLGGPTEVVRPEETGVLVKPGDPNELAIAIVRLLGDHERRQMMGAAAAASARERFTSDRMTRQFEALYETAAAI